MTGTPRHIRIAMGVGVLLVSQAWLPAIADDTGHNAAASTCHGKRATIVGNDGDNRLVGTKRRDVIVARGGRDKIFGGGGRDLICAGGGDDTLQGGKGDDYLSGDRGYDRVSYRSAPRRVIVRLPRGSATGQGEDRLVSVNSVRGSRFHDIIRGNAQFNNIIGGDGNDLIYGGAGPDTIGGNAGGDALIDTRGENNTVYGKQGSDRVIIGPNEGDVVNAGSGWDSLSFSTTGGVTVDLGAHVVSYPANALVGNLENLDGTVGNDALYGSDWDENFYAGYGDDYIDGRDGRDLADGGAGNDGCINVEPTYDCEY